ncbi:hypothetical protein KKC13_00220 [bacterium]|nr:hypothetical protein [bacterium]MBU1956800.1 hypothetical protein [bacterium]
MIKTILSTAVAAVVFSGCVGTANIVKDTTDVKSSAVQNAKSTKDVADEHTDGKASVVKDLIK